MQVIGSGFTKISAERLQSYKKHTGTSTNIEFTSIEKEEVPLLEKQEAIKISYKFLIGYEDREKSGDKKDEKKEKRVEPDAEVVFEGNLVLSAEKDEAKEILKAWKKKDLPNSFKVPLFNVIIKRCTTQALKLEEELSLPTHLPFPQLNVQPQAQQQAGQ